MKRKIILTLITFFVLGAAILVGLRSLWAQNQGQQNLEIIDGSIPFVDSYAGAVMELLNEEDTPNIDRWEVNIRRWVAEMQEERVEVTLQKLTDAAEWLSGIHGAPMHPGGSLMFPGADQREREFYHISIETILSHRRFRKAHEDLQKVGKKKAAELLTQNIKTNISELRKELLRDINTVSRGDHKGGTILTTSYPLEEHYRSISRPDFPPTRTGRRYAVHAYIWLAALLELQEVRPAVEEAIQLARDEYQLYNSIDEKIEFFSFRADLLHQSIYNPSLLVTATLCDPTWNVEQKKRLEGKLVNKEIVDWQARSTEYNRIYDKNGFVSATPYNAMLKIRYYKGITDEELNDFFGK